MDQIIVTKFAGIDSHATGYDYVRITTINGEFHNSVKYTIHSASMRRFYNLSGGMMTFSTTKMIQLKDYYKYNLKFLYNLKGD